MKKASKIIAIVLSVILGAVLIFGIVWGIINYDKLSQGMQGTNLYTQADIDKAYQDGYATAGTDKSSYEKLIEDQQKQIATLTEAQDGIRTEAQAQVIEAQRKYDQLVESYGLQDSAVIIYIVNEKIYDMEAVETFSEPHSLISINGNRKWTVNGETVESLSLEKGERYEAIKSDAVRIGISGSTDVYIDGILTTGAIYRRPDTQILVKVSTYNISSVLYVRGFEVRDSETDVVLATYTTSSNKFEFEATIPVPFVDCYIKVITYRI